MIFHYSFDCVIAFRLLLGEEVIIDYVVWAKQYVMCNKIVIYFR